MGERDKTRRVPRLEGESLYRKVFETKERERERESEREGERERVFAVKKDVCTCCCRTECKASVLNLAF
jgi:hypothetical protein